MLRAQRHHRLRALRQCLKPGLQALRFAPLDLLLHVVEQGDDIAKTVLDVDIAVGDGDEQDLEFLGQSGECKKDREDVVDALGGC